MLSMATFGPLASLQLQDFQAQHHSRTHISPAKQTHLSCPQGTEVTRPSQGQKCESRSKPRILRFLSVLFYRSSFQQCKSQFGTILYKGRSKRWLLPPKKPFSPCVAWERGWCKPVREYYGSCTSVIAQLDGGFAESVQHSLPWFHSLAGCCTLRHFKRVIHKLLEVSS